MLTDNQRHYVLNILRHIESETQEGIAALESEDPAALFPRYHDFPDRTSITRLRSHLARLRSVMRRFMETQGIADAAPSAIDASWAFQTRMTLARNAAFELAPSHLRGYGPLDTQGEEDCRALMAELGLLLDDVGSELRRPPLEVSASTTSDSLLIAVVDAIEHHHLLELRPAARDLLVGLQGKQRVEVAFLGRVSSGKSSLVNAILGQSLLPVGAVPVTAVVTRVQYGEVPRARTLDIDGRQQDVPFDQLGQYISESGNADNRLRLREVVVDLPHPALRRGIVLTDTPGLGSLHPRASSHALTYLPRCDLGIVTVDAGATLQPQDVDLVRALIEAHALCVVVLTKADTVTPGSLEEQRGYVERTMAQALGAPFAITSVSVVAHEAHPLDTWQKDVLQPALTQAVKQSGERARMRLVALARRVCVLLEQAQGEGQGAATASATHTAGSTLAALEETESALRRLIGDLGLRGATVVLNDALPEVMQSNDAIGSHITNVAGQLADDVVRDVLSRLQEVASGLSEEALATILRGAPPFVFSSEREPVKRPRRGLSAWVRHRWQALLNDTYARPLEQAFQAYGQELTAWLHQTVHTLRIALGGDVLATAGEASSTSSVASDLDRLRRLLASPPSVASSLEPRR